VTSSAAEIALDDPLRDDVLALLGEHLADMYATSPAESVHALDPHALTAPGVTFWTARQDGALLGCGALKELAVDAGEIKSMRTAAVARGRGVAAAVLQRIVAEAVARGYGALSLETGTEPLLRACPLALPPSRVHRVRAVRRLSRRSAQQVPQPPPGV